MVGVSSRGSRSSTAMALSLLGFVMFGDLEPLKSISRRIEALRTDLHSARTKLEAMRRSKYNFSQFVGNSEVVAAVKQQRKLPQAPLSCFW